MRVLHVIDPGSPGGGACTLQLLSEPIQRIKSIHQDVLLVGTERHEELAKRCGVTPTGRITAPRNQPILCGFCGENFKRFLETYEAGRQPYDIIHSWSPRSLLLSTIAAPRHKRMATLAVGPVNSFLMHGLAKMLHKRPAVLMATTVNVKRDYVVLGLPEDQIEVLAPAVHPEAVEEHSDSREVVRSRWGLAANDDAFVVGLLAEPASWCDARQAIAAVALAAECGRNVKLAVHPLAQRRLDAATFARRLNREDMLILDDELTEPWRSMNGLDAALLLGDDSTTVDLSEGGSPFSLIVGGGRALRPMPGVMPALWAMGAGVPVVAEHSMAMAEIVDNDETGFLVKQRDPNDAARALVRIIDESDTRSRISTAARAHVHNKYHVSAYCVRLKDLYSRVYEDRMARVFGSRDDVIEQRHSATQRR